MAGAAVFVFQKTAGLDPTLAKLPQRFSRRVARPFALHRNSVTPRVDFAGAAVFVFQKAAGLDQTPAKLPLRSLYLIPQNGTARRNDSRTKPR